LELNISNENYSRIRNYFIEGIKVVRPIQLIQSAISLEEESLTITDITGKVEIINLNQIRKIFVVGAGKASSTMAKKIEEILGNRINSGVIVTKYGFIENLDVIELVEAGHPIPDENGIEGAKEIIELCKNAGENDLIINLISGGASALLPKPSMGITLAEKASVTSELLKLGATIDELNTIRKHLSEIKGGKLLKYSYPAKIISLILSDVIGDKLDVIGSGITVEDKSTFKDCIEIIKKYNLELSFPKSVITHLRNGYELEKISDESVKIDKSKISNFIIGNNSIVLQRIKELAELDGYITKIKNWQLEGEAKEVAKNIIKDTFKFIEEKSKPNGKYCFLYGGETSVTITGNGKGGRNQELALSAAIELNGILGVTFLSGGTDGNDGPTDAAGAICNSQTVRDGFNIGLNAEQYLANNDSYNYFKKIDSLLVTGPTGTNVIDVQIVLVET
jgi:glycerate-2-kinase